MSLYLTFTPVKNTKEILVLGFRLQFEIRSKNGQLNPCMIDQKVN